MCLETHFQYEFSLLGRFGQAGLQRKKNQTAIFIRLCNFCQLQTPSFQKDKIVEFAIINQLKNVNISLDYKLHKYLVDVSWQRLPN